MKPIPKGRGDFLADGAYLSRANFTLVEKKGRKPFIRPKANTKPRGRGSTAWRGMVTLYRGVRRRSWLGTTAGLGLSESVWSVLKRVYGNSPVLEEGEDAEESST